MDWTAPIKPFEMTYSQLAKAIITGVFPAGSSLPGERQLSEMIGVTRPTLRESLQRLAADGWLEIQQGKSTRVKDIWVEGSLNTLSTLVQYIDTLPEEFIIQLLQVRTALAPSYAGEAVDHNGETLSQFIEQNPLKVTDTAAVFAAFDWNLHHQMTLLSQNPIYTLILNGFASLYPLMAEKYFLNAKAKEYSLAFYLKLREAAAANDSQKARDLVQEVMESSVLFWQSTAHMNENER